MHDSRSCIASTAQEHRRENCELQYPNGDEQDGIDGVTHDSYSSKCVAATRRRFSFLRFDIQRKLRCVRTAKGLKHHACQPCQNGAPAMSKCSQAPERASKVFPIRKAPRCRCRAGQVSGGVPRTLAPRGASAARFFRRRKLLTFVQTLGCASTLSACGFCAVGIRGALSLSRFAHIEVFTQVSNR